MADIIGISASPRSDMSTEFFMDKILTAAREVQAGEITTDQINLSGLEVGHCRGCGYCASVLGCKQDDDFTNHIIPILKKDDWKALIFGTPVYFGGISSLGKAFIDRTVPFRRNGYLFRNRYAGGFSVAGGRNGGQELVLSAVHNAFIIHDMLIVGDGFDTSHFGGAAWNPKGSEYKNDIDGLKTAENLGRRIAELVSTSR